MAEPASPPAILWFRRDLRLADNPALQAAAKGGRAVVPLFILEDDAPTRGAGGAALWWLNRSLQALEASLEVLGSRLVLRHGAAQAVLQALAQECGARTVVWTKAWEPQLDKRDEVLANALREGGLEVVAASGKLLVEPGEVCTKTGKPYTVFSPFWRTVRPRLGHDKPSAAPKRLAAPAHWPDSEPLKSWGLQPSAPDWSGGFDWTPGEAGAQAGLKTFLDKALASYPRDRDRPALDGSSRLSPHLAWGEISPRQIFCAVETRLKDHPLSDQADKFLSELAWRDFDYGILALNPELHAKPFKPTPRLKWRRDAHDLQAWKKGRTGYPIVDAGMRQLWTYGWMHNRLRLITSSFLVKHLLIDWREGERWFWDCLVDADPANNPANWQWIAGTGADAQPFFRIFAPITQGKKFDPRADYIRRWVPELANLEPKWAHEPWTAPPEVLADAGVKLGNDYPEPIIAHEAARERALAALKAARAAA